MNVCLNLWDPFLVKDLALKTGVAPANARRQLIAHQGFPIAQNWDFATEELCPSTRNSLIFNRTVIFSSLFAKTSNLKNYNFSNLFHDNLIYSKIWQITKLVKHRKNFKVCVTRKLQTVVSIFSQTNPSWRPATGISK